LRERVIAGWILKEFVTGIAIAGRRRTYVSLSGIGCVPPVLTSVLLKDY
jgi:hypothetical protein